MTYKSHRYATDGIIVVSRSECLPPISSDQVRHRFHNMQCYYFISSPRENKQNAVLRKVFLNAVSAVLQGHAVA
jgi:hypothetical protein